MNLTGENAAFESPDSGLQESGFSAMINILSNRQGKHMTASAKTRDIRFGNKLTALRQSRGLTQEFVAMKLNVSDGAVSKWETGASKPKASRAAALAKLLGVDIDTLLDDDVMTPAEAKQMKEEQRKVIFEKARKRAVEIYGSGIPPVILDRYYREEEALEGSDRIIFFDIIAEVRRAAKEKRKYFEVGEPESLIAWLLGRSDLNPVEAHYRCPKCRKTEMHPEVRSGYDLPEKFCECGTRMIKDGHGIPFEVTGFFGSSEDINYRCDIDADFIDEAEDIILRYGEQFYDMEVTRHQGEEVIITDPETGQPFIDPETGKRMRIFSNRASFLMFTPKKKFTVRKPEKISGPMDVDQWGQKPGQHAIALWPGLFNPKYPLSPVDNFFGTSEELTRPEVFERALKDYWAWLPVMDEIRGELKMPDYRKYLEGMNFSMFIDLLASVNCLYIGSGPEELAEKLGLESFLEIPFTATDIYRLIQRSAPHPERYPGLIRRIALKIYHCDFYYYPIKDYERELLRELNFPEWFDEYTKDIYIMTARSIRTTDGIRMLEDARRKIRDGR